MSAAESFPRLRPNLHYVRHVQDGRTVYVVKDPVSLRYYRFGELETWIMQRLDGTRPLSRLAHELTESVGVRATVATLETFVRRLKELGLVMRTQAERSLLVLEAVRRQRRFRLEGHGNTLFRMRFSLGDPDRLFGRLVRPLRFFWTPAFVMLSAGAFAAYALIVATHWGSFVDGVAAMYRPDHYTVGFILMLYLTASVIFGIHELGHGLTCKHFGGEVHEIGAMLLYFSPAFFCNVNDAWTFPERSHRLWVTFAGGWIQLLLAAVGAAVWMLTDPDSVVHDVAFLTLLIGGGVSVLFNYNPLIPLDGYYALLDWLEIPNLRGRSFQYLGAYCKRSVLRLNVPLPAATARERRVFLVFGSLAFLYTLIILTVFVTWLGGVLVGKLGVWGWLLVALLAYAIAGKAARRAWRVVRVWAAEKAPGPVVRRRLVWGAAGVAGLAAVAFVFPWTIRAPARAVVEPVARAWLRPGDDGWVEAVLVREAEPVRAGQPLAVLRNPALELEWTRARAAVAALEGELAAARAAASSARARLAELELTAARRELDVLDQRRSALLLRAPFVGIVATPHPEELIGAHVAPGDSLFEVWRGGPVRARIFLHERDAGDLRAGAAVGLKFPVHPAWTWRSHIAVISPASRDGRVEALVPLGDPGQLPLRPGMVGRAKIVLQRATVARALGRGLRRTLRVDWLL
ncbi:MAG: efflux RND transporter periplasmic adaptor subunit [Gemmatimonadetes bacterium]|nr:efflux RND transporter periplasmic adaptor subunit [Gemmatimonadota bacterium]